MVVEDVEGRTTEEVVDFAVEELEEVGTAEVTRLVVVVDEAEGEIELELEGLQERVT